MSAAASGGGIAIGDSFLHMPLLRLEQVAIPVKTALLGAQSFALYAPHAPFRCTAARRFEDWLRAAVQTYQSTILDELARLGIRVVKRA